MTEMNAHQDRRPVHVIFGATGGIGSCLARRLHAAGARLTLAGRDPARLKTLADQLHARTCTVDATDFEQVQACLTETAEAHDVVDGVVNCVGSVLLKPAHLTAQQELDEVLKVNLHSAFATVRAAAGVMRQTGGAVVLLSSAAAQIGLANHEAIAAAKAGIIGLARSAATTYAAQGLRVNAVAPGLVDTPLTKRITSNPAALNASRALHPLGRIGTVDDIASAIEWLLLPQSSWMTGQVIGVDGGLATLKSMRTPRG